MATETLYGYRFAVTASHKASAEAQAIRLFDWFHKHMPANMYIRTEDCGIRNGLHFWEVTFS